jgi:hypothetical protein
MITGGKGSFVLEEIEIASPQLQIDEVVLE